MIVSGPGETVSPVLPLTELSVAEMVVVPVATAVASPPALIDAAAVFEDAHVTWLVRFCVLESEYVPVAVNCWVAPTVSVAFAGVTAIEVSVATGVVVEVVVDVVVDVVGDVVGDVVVVEVVVDVVGDVVVDVVVVEVVVDVVGDVVVDVVVVEVVGDVVVDVVVVAGVNTTSTQ